MGFEKRDLTAGYAVMTQYLLFTKRSLMLGLLMIGVLAPFFARAGLDISQTPLAVGGSGTPLVMLVLGRDHKLYYEAYNDASDLDGDGVLDTTYKPDKIDYFGLFDSFLCYSYGSEKFTPTQKTITKKCGGGTWSGDFLNYLTTSRMDALRKVLYGGYRIPASDTVSGTVLERSYIPQDAHSWGKEYRSTAYDGYNIQDYAPLAQPVAGTRHLFANTTLLNDVAQKPLLRVLQNSVFRVWEWLSIERPVAGDQCVWGATGDANTSGAEYRETCIYAGNYYEGPPANYWQFVSLFRRYADSLYYMGSGSVTQINGSGNPFGASDRYLTVFVGTLRPTQNGSYQFSFVGDDTAQLWIDGVLIGGLYNNTTTNQTATLGTMTLTADKTYNLELRHQERAGSGNYQLRWKRDAGSTVVIPTTAFPTGLTRTTYRTPRPSSTRTDYTVRVDACVSGKRTENDPDASEYCRGYPVSSPTVFKPAGLLQQYGEDEPERMAFGLISGSYIKNTDGGVLRKNIGPFSKTGDASNEIIRDTGVFDTSVNGIVQTLNNFKVTRFGGTYTHDCNVDGSYGYPADWITTRPINPGECRMWGNPIGEMLYESLRYFAGKPTTSAPAPTSDFTYADANDDGLTLPKPTWQYPFRSQNAGGYSGAKCFMLTISDINPSYDTDKVPGTAFGSFTGDLTGLDAAALAQTIWNNEEKSNPAFIGHSLDNTPPYDGAPTAKTVTSLGRIRGLSPEEPTKQGGFYSASVAAFGNISGISGDTAKAGKQRVETFSVALASPLPRIEIPIGTGDAKRYVTLVPFAKSVDQVSINPTQGQFQPTNQIVDFYVEKIDYADPTNGGRPRGIFRINFEDVEQGADHDMDAIVRYEFWVLADGTIQVRLDSTYAAGGIEQHLGYVISGTDGQDGIYLDVRDQDTAANADGDYFLDTPLQTTTDATGMTRKRAEWPTNVWQDSTALPLTATRRFRPATGATAPAAAYIKHDPLWYAAKWGGFRDRNNNGVPDAGEWDSKQSGTLDNYFLVTNAGRLKKQLSEAFSSILSTSGSASVVALNTSKAYGPENVVYQAQFNSGDWSGNILALDPTSAATGTLKATTTWDAGEKIDQTTPSSRAILTYKPSEEAGIAFRWPGDPASPSATELDTPQAQILSTPKADGTYDAASYATGRDRLEFLRGDNTKEGEAAGKFRKRGSDLGDIVNSSPVYVEKPNGGYRDNLESVSYSSFINTGRPPMIYVGSNDGMLHGFGGVDGSEKIAYVPSLAFKQLALLTRQDYNTSTGAGSANAMNPSQHRYYVDGQIRVGDAFYDGAWHSVLVGRLGAGGQGVFALDVTNPANFSESNANSLVLWEFTDADDPDLGFTLGGSWVTKMKNGQWAAVFGNGYNSDNTIDDVHVGTGQGVLFIVEAQTGEVIQKLDAGSGSGGLSSPAIYDVDRDGKTDWIYAGDTQGNLWKFDVSSNNKNDWTVKKLFTAATTNANGDSVGQPITSAPSLMAHPEGGVMVLFGTGRFLGTTDMTNIDTQSYYGIWDQEGATDAGGNTKPFATVTINQLLRQVFGDTVTINGALFRTSSNTEMTTQRGWYIDLPDRLTGSGSERVYEDSALYKGLIIFVSKVPAQADPTAEIEPCSIAPPGGRSWPNVLDALTGKRAKTTFVEVDAEGKTTKVKTEDDIAPSSQAIGGITGGPSVTLDGYILISRPARPEEPVGKAIPIEVLKIGEDESEIGPGGRRTWRQLR
jgi:type IV pilus assembly protein PilY1